MRAFTYIANPARVIFGAGSLDRIGEELTALGAQRALVLCTPPQRDQAEDVARRLGDRAAGVFDRAVMHVPIETAEEARAVARELGADACIAVGGGSTIGLGKAIALTSDLPILAVPTTYAGSEMTPIWGLTEGGMKRTGRDPRVLPRTVLYDPLLTLSLPPAIAGASGMNAIAHAVEGLYSSAANPVMDMIAEDSIAAFARALPRIAEAPDDLEARTEGLYGAWLAGIVLGSVGMALHHKLCHTLGGSFNLPHAEVHTVVIPHATAYNAPATPKAMAAVRRALGAADAAGGLFDLAERIGAPTALKDIGFAEADIDKAAKIATQNQYDNPRPVTEAAVRDLLRAAWAGERPTEQGG